MARFWGLQDRVVTDTECIHEFVPYEGDTVSRNFAVVDHDIFSSSDLLRIDLTVRTRSLAPAILQYSMVKFDGWISVRLDLWVVLMGIWPSGGLNWGSVLQVPCE